MIPSLMERTENILIEKINLIQNNSLRRRTTGLTRGCPARIAGHADTWHVVECHVA